MTKSLSEIETYLDSVVGQSLSTVDGELQGQCVSLAKALLEYLGVPNAHAARGNAKDLPITYTQQGIAKSGLGQLNLFINTNIGGGYGHVWVADATGTLTWEQNGAQALHVTKNTAHYAVTNIINLDQWLTPQTTVGLVKVINECNVRTAPSITATIVQQPTASTRLEPGYVFVVKASVTGDTVANNHTWFETPLNHYVWSGNCEQVQ